MPNDETPAERYRRLGGECLTVARTMPEGEGRTTLLEMAQLWHCLADDYAGSTVSLRPSVVTETKPTMQQQQQGQPNDDKKELNAQQDHCPCQGRRAQPRHTLRKGIERHS